MGRCWRELVCRCPSGFQLGCGFLPDLAQGGDHVRADVPLVFEQHRCRVLHRGELARLGVLQVPGSARPRHAVTPIFRDGRAQPIQFLEQVRQFPRHDDPLPATPLMDACSVPSTPSEVKPPTCGSRHMRSAETAEPEVIHPRRRRDRSVNPERRRGAAGHAVPPSRTRAEHGEAASLFVASPRERCRATSRS